MASVLKSFFSTFAVERGGINYAYKGNSSSMRNVHHDLFVG